MSTKSRPKIWSALGVASTCVAASIGGTPALADGEQGISEPYDPFQGNFSRALELMLMGEGGEGGIGISRMRPSVSVPALTGEQIERAVRGNTLAIPYHYALHFETSGDVGGYTVEYQAAPGVEDCPQPEIRGDDYLYYDGNCSIRTSVPWSGKWRVEDDRLCMNVEWPKGSEQDCYYVAFMLNSVALFKSNGQLSAKGHVLKKGMQGDE